MEFQKVYRQAVKDTVAPKTTVLSPEEQSEQVRVGNLHKNWGEHPYTRVFFETLEEKIRLLEEQVSGIASLCDSRSSVQLTSLVNQKSLLEKVLYYARTNNSKQLTQGN